MLKQLLDRLEAIRTERAAALEAMEEVTALAETETRSLTSEEDVAFTERMAEITALDTEADQLQAKVDELEKIEARSQVVNKIAPFNVNKNEDPFDTSGLRFGAGRADLHGRVRRVLDEDRASRLSLTGDERGQVSELLDRVDNKDGIIARHILATGKDAYRDAFTKVMSGNDFALNDAERAAMTEMRASSLTDAAGGFAVPFTLDPTIIDTGDHSVNPMRQLGTVRQTVTDNWQGVSSAGVTASWDAEAAEVSDDAPTLAQPAIPVHKAQVFVPYSIEVGQDWANMEADIRMMFAVAKDDLEATAHITGSGSGQPTGIVTALVAGSATVAPATAETFAVADVYAMEEAVAARYRARASWVANKSIYNDIRQFDTSGGGQMWERLGNGQPSRLLGYESYEASAMDGAFDPAATATNYLLVFGDLSYYYIVDRVGMTVDTVPHLFHTSNNRPSGQRGLYGFWRTGADSVNDSAANVLSIPTTA